MSEVTFAKSFLATLDKRPIKLSADYVSDPKRYPNSSPYVLPRQSHPFPRPTTAGAASAPRVQAGKITVTLKPMRGGEAVSLADVSLDATIHDVKGQYAARSNLVQDKIKLLLNKKPAADLKTLKDLGVDADVELSVMLMAGATASSSGASTPTTAEPAAAAPKTAAAAPQSSAPPSEQAHVDAENAADAAGVNTTAQMLQSDEFWSDLQAFLAQRLRDDEQSKVLAGLFKDAWKKQ